MTLRLYRLEGKVPVPCGDDVKTWASSFGSPDAQVALTQVGSLYVSTIFLGLAGVESIMFPDLPPLLFETMILPAIKGRYQVRTATWEEAEAAHAEAVKVAGGDVADRLVEQFPGPDPS